MAVLLLLLTCAAAQAPKVTTVLDMKEFTEDWKISRQFTLDVANAMPAESYDFKASPEEMSFGQQMVHIARANVYRFNQISGVKPPFELDFNKQPPADKASAMKMLEQSFDYVIAVLPQITSEQLQKTFHTDWRGRPDPDGRAMMLNMFVHTAHHRAQCEVYLRLKGIKPPTYTF
jgi:uncharacterized damage-inducible protein DinB